MTEEPSPLSEREMEIVRLVATGASNRQIARALYISVNTVKVHLRNIFAKLELNSRTEVAMYAVSQGWVTVGEAQPETVAKEDETADAGEEETPAAAAGAPTGRRRWRLLVVGGAVALLILILLGGAMAGGVIPLLTTPTAPGSSPLATGATMTALPSRWRELAPLPVPRTGLALEVYEGRLYAIGGETSDGVVGVVTRYDPQSDTWTARSAKPTPVTDVGAALLGGRIFVPGGRTAAGEVTGRVEVYDPEADRWTVTASLPVPLSAYALTAFEGQLYLFGGWDGSRFVSTTYAYDPARDTWMTRTSMPTARGYAGAVVADGKIFVVGGYDGRGDLTANEEYVPNKDNGGEASPWAARAPLPSGRGGAGVVSVANQIHVIGGGWTQGRAASVKYNVRNDHWDEFETPTTSVWRNMGVGAAETKIYCVGGWDGVRSLASNHEYQALYIIIIPMAITPTP